MKNIYILMLMTICLAHQASGKVIKGNAESGKKVTPQFVNGGIIHLKRAELKDMIMLDGAWKFHNGDNMQWARPEFQDSSWGTKLNYLNMNSKVKDSFTGKAWFRLHIYLDSVLDQPLGLILRESGSSEIYVDGKKIASYKSESNPDSAYNPGNVPISVNLSGGKEHLLAIRYKNNNAWSNYKKFDEPNAGFFLKISNIDNTIEFYQAQAKVIAVITMFLLGLFLCIAALHFLFYLYNREEKSNYSYGSYALLMAILWFIIFSYVNSNNPYTIMIVGYSFSIVIKGILLATLRLLYSLFFPYKGKKTFLFWLLSGHPGKTSVFYWITFISAIASILLDKFNVSWSYLIDILFYGLVSIDMLRVTIKAVIQKKEGSLIVGSAIFFLLFYIIAVIIISLFHPGENFDTSTPLGSLIIFGLIVCIICIPIAMSFYLARRFARLNRDLKKKLLEVEELSAKNLLAEQEKQKMLENRKEELEKQVLQRTAEVTMQKEQILQKSEELGKSLEELKSAHSQLVQQEKMASLGQLTAGIAHEINNPINFVSNSIPSLKRDIHDLMEVYRRYDEMHHATGSMEEKLKSIEILKKQMDIPYAMDEINSLLQGIQDGASRTAEIVKSLRNFSRLDENDIKKADINEGLTSTLTILHSQMQEGIQLETELGALPRIDCYPGQLNQVFMNIITNAIQAIEGKGTISIKTWQEGPEVKISIKDSGQGMSEEVKKKIFDPFYTTKDVGKGTGLGLSISYNIIEKHKGRIEVSSQPGKGTEFIITLPVEME